MIIVTEDLFIDVNNSTKNKLYLNIGFINTIDSFISKVGDANELNLLEDSEQNKKINLLTLRRK